MQENEYHYAVHATSGIDQYMNVEWSFIVVAVVTV